MMSRLSEALESRPRLRRTVEVAVAVTAALALLAWGRTIGVNPTVRLGQVSGLASIQLRFAVLALPLLVGVILVQRAGTPPARSLATRLACAALAGLATGAIAAGMAVALRGTPWALGGAGGDSGRVERWAAAPLTTPDYYPPGFIYLLAAWARLTSQPTAYAFKDLQLIGVAVYGPLAYLAWRQLLRPVWALAIGVIAAIPLVQPHKPYANIILVLLVPTLVRLLQIVRTADGWPRRRLLVTGAAFGLAIGTGALMYWGWLLWIGPGAVVAWALLVPWSRRPRPALLFTAAAVATFAVVAGWPLVQTLRHPLRDSYFYFDVFADPAYIAMWRNDGADPKIGVWPPSGELGGVGLFSLALFVGFGLALAWGRRRTIVLALASFTASAWLLRFWFGARMWKTGLVNLYPRTTPLIFHCLVVAAGFAVYFGVLAARRGPRPRPSPRRPTPVVAALAALALTFASMASATVDSYLPRDEASMAHLAWAAHHTRKLDGDCPKYAAECGE